MIRLFPRRAGIAVLELHGVLGATVSAPAYHQLLDRLERSPRIAAVLLDIDSPGGTVSASEALYMKVRRLREKKPVVAFIRGSGASGSYMVACAATRIVALPSALVGSIGVISMRPVADQLLERLGVSVSVSKSGPLKDMGAFYRPPTDEEQEKIQAIIDELYEAFVERVAAARGMDKEQARRHATGEVYTATRGKELGLVDELMDYDDALDATAALGGVPRRVRHVRPPRSMRHRMMGRFALAAMEAVAEDAGLGGARGLWYL